MAIAFTDSQPDPKGSREDDYNSVFLPIVKPEMMDSWKRTWKDWFVSTKEVTDERKPGKLKLEFAFRKGVYVGLAPKSYFALDFESEETKLGSKGIPHSAKLKLNNYLNALHIHKEQPDNSHYVNIRSLRLKKGRMARINTKKQGLSDLFFKFHVQEDGITCKALQNKKGYL